MRKYISSFAKNITQSFDNNPNSGFSARKLSAFLSVMIAFYVTIHYCNTEVLVDVIYAWLVFALLCLGIITIEQIIRLKNGNTTTITTDNSEQSSTTKSTTTIQSDSV